MATIIFIEEVIMKREYHAYNCINQMTVLLASAQIAQHKTT